MVNTYSTFDSQQSSVSNIFRITRASGRFLLVFFCYFIYIYIYIYIYVYNAFISPYISSFNYLLRVTSLHKKEHH